MTQVVLLHNCKLSNNWLKIMFRWPFSAILHWRCQHSVQGKMPINTRPEVSRQHYGITCDNNSTA